MKKRLRLARGAGVPNAAAALGWPAGRGCEQITFNAETAEVAEKCLALLKATTKARRHEESQRTFRVFVFSCLRGIFPRALRAPRSNVAFFHRLGGKRGNA